MSEPWGRQLEVGCTRLAGWGRWGWYGRFSQEHREPVPSRQTEAPESWGSSSPSPKVPEPTAPVSQPRQSSNPASVPCLFALPRPPPRGGGPLLIPSRFSAHVFLRHLLSWHPGAQLGAHNKQPQGGEGGEGLAARGGRCHREWPGVRGRSRQAGSRSLYGHPMASPSPRQDWIFFGIILCL